MGTKKEYYDLATLKCIPIPDVLARFGIEVNHAGFFAIRKERTPSAKYYKNTNTYCDFGMHNDGGDVLKLYAVLSGMDKRDAIEAFAREFGIIPVEHDNQKEIMLTDSQYKLIGLYGDMASKNMSFDFEHFSWDTNYKFAKRYQIPMNDLKKQDLKRYESIIVSTAIPYVERLQLLMKQEMQENYVFNEVLYENVQQPEDIKRKFERTYDDVLRAEKILEIACAGCVNVHYKSQHDSVVELYDSVKKHMTPLNIIKVLQNNPIYLDIYCSTPMQKKSDEIGQGENDGHREQAEAEHSNLKRI